MKIAVFYNLPFSGAKRTVQEHVRGLSQLGNEVDVYSINSKEDIFSPERFSVNNFSFDYKRISSEIPVLKKILADFSDFYLLKNLHKKIAKEIDAKNYDYVLVHSDHFTQAPFVLRFLKTRNGYFCLEPLKIAYEYGLRIDDSIFYMNKIYESLNRSFRKKIDRENARSAENSFAISLFGRELMISSFDLYPKISYLGIDPNVFKKTNIKKKNQILFVGQKLKINGYDFILDALNRIPKNIRPELKVVSIGKGNRLSDKEIVKLYNESLLTVCLSNFDTFGLVTLESMACGTPVIAFNVAGYREIVLDKKAGFLVDFDSEEISKKITDLITDKKLRIRMGEIGVDWVNKNWTWEKHIKNLNEILQHERI